MTETPTPDDLARWARHAANVSRCDQWGYGHRQLVEEIVPRLLALVAAQAEQNAELRGENQRLLAANTALRLGRVDGDAESAAIEWRTTAHQLAAERDAARAELSALRATDEYQRWARAVTERDAAREAVAKLLDAILASVRNEDDHSHFNGHRLDRDCQGVAPGEHVPAIRTVGVWASLAGALRLCGVPFPEAYRAQLDGDA